MANNTNLSLPYIFILDLDQTIIGDCKYQVSRYSLLNTMKRQGLKVPPMSHTAIPHAYHEASHLIRPGFGTFVKSLKNHYPWVEFFVYTASVKDWANQEIFWIEKSLGIRINRPIFTREDCIVDSAGSYKKSLGKIMPRVWRALGKKRQLTKSDRLLVVQKQLMVIDNTAVYIDFTDKLLLCPDYNYVAFEDVLEGVRNITSTQLLSLVNQNVVCPQIMTPSSDYLLDLASRYKWMAGKCTSLASLNIDYKKDQFWRRLRKLIINNKLTSFTMEIIQQLQSAVWGKK